MPAHVGICEHRHHRAGLGQQRCTALALRAQQQPVRAGHVGVFGAQARDRRLHVGATACGQALAFGDLYDEDGHGLRVTGLAAL